MRYASSSTSAVATTTPKAGKEPKKSLWQRIAARADAVAVNARPSVGKLRAAMLEDNVRSGEGSIFQQTVRSETAGDKAAARRAELLQTKRYTEVSV